MLASLKRIVVLSDLKNVVILSGGVFGAQIISVIVQPIATRLYSPLDFGMIAIVTSLVSMFAPVLNGHYDLCIVTVPSEEESIIVTSLALRVGMIMSAAVGIGIFLYKMMIPGAFGGAGALIFAAIPMILLSAITNVLNSYNNRHREYKLLASLSLVRSSASNAVKLAFGVFGSGSLGLLASAITGLVAGLGRQSRGVRKNKGRILKVGAGDLWAATKQYRAQPLFSAPGIFVVSYSYAIVTFLMSSLYGVKEVGFYSLSMGMLGLPISLFSANVGRVFFRNASDEKARTGGFRKSLTSSLILLVAIAVVPFLLLYIFGEPIFSFAFGRQWIRSGAMVRLLIPWYFMNFVVGSLVIGLIISGKQFLKLALQGLFIVSALICHFGAKYCAWSSDTFLLSVSIAYAATYSIILFVLYMSSAPSKNTDEIGDRGPQLSLE
jgi:O-antigen/teichoic acid export membrane protein